MLTNILYKHNNMLINNMIHQLRSSRAYKQFNSNSIMKSISFIRYINSDISTNDKLKSSISESNQKNGKQNDNSIINYEAIKLKLEIYKKLYTNENNKNINVLYNNTYNKFNPNNALDIEILEKIYLLANEKNALFIEDYERMIILYINTSRLLKALHLLEKTIKLFNPPNNEIVLSMAVELLIEKYMQLNDLNGMNSIFKIMNDNVNSKCFDSMIQLCCNVNDEYSASAYIRKMKIKGFSPSPISLSKFIHISNNFNDTNLLNDSLQTHSQDIHGCVVLLSNLIDIYSKSNNKKEVNYWINYMESHNYPLSTDIFNSLLEAALRTNFNGIDYSIWNGVSNEHEHTESINLMKANFNSTWSLMLSKNVQPDSKTLLLKLALLLRSNDFDGAKFLFTESFQEGSNNITTLSFILPHELLEKILESGYTRGDESSLTSSFEMVSKLANYFNFQLTLSIFIPTLKKLFAGLQLKKLAPGQTKNNLVTVILKIVDFLKSLNPPMYASSAIYIELVDELVKLNRNDEAFPLVEILENYYQQNIPARHIFWVAETKLRKKITLPEEYQTISNSLKWLPMPVQKYYKYLLYHPNPIYYYTFVWIYLIGGGFLLAIIVLYIGEILGEKFPNSFFRIFRFFKVDPERVKVLKKNQEDVAAKSQILFDRALNEYATAHDIPLSELPNRISSTELKKIKSQVTLQYYSKASTDKMAKEVEEYKKRKVDAYEKKVADINNQKPL